MRHIAPGTGSLSDQVNSVGVLLPQCADLKAVEHRYPQLLRYLDGVRARVDGVARRGGPVSSIGTETWNRQRYTPSFSGATGPFSACFSLVSPRTGRISRLLR
jgi:hypothetical protein